VSQRLVCTDCELWQANIRFADLRLFCADLCPCRPHIYLNPPVAGPQPSSQLNCSHLPNNSSSSQTSCITKPSRLNKNFHEQKAKQKCRTHPETAREDSRTSPRGPIARCAYMPAPGPEELASSRLTDQGNHYCARDYGSGAANSNSYHYSNTCVFPEKPRQFPNC
jgi:hypothetical protein